MATPKVPTNKPNTPRCFDCDGAASIPVAWANATPQQLSGDHPGGYWWLCGSCVYKREHPDAIPMPPRTRAPKAPQKESLLDLLDVA